MKKFSILATIIASSMVLTACGGGDSGSSGSDATVPASPTTPSTTPVPSTTPAPSTNPTPAPTTGTTPTNTSNACAINGSTVYATAGGCTYANPAINGGASITYTCSGGRVSSSIGISAANIILNGVTITCKP